jgi:hypothetical protein
MKYSGSIRMRGRGLRACAAAAALAVATPAVAGLVDSPVPNLDGQAAEVVFYVPGVQSTARNGDTPDLDTVFTCTSLESSQTVIMSVEVFQYDGSGPVGNWLPKVYLIPGQTGSISTNNTVGYGADDRLDLETQVPGGAARIISTSKKIICSAVLARTASSIHEHDPYPAPSCNLRVVRNLQKGD